MTCKKGLDTEFDGLICSTSGALDWSLALYLAPCKSLRPALVLDVLSGLLTSTRGGRKISFEEKCDEFENSSTQFSRD